MLRVRGGWFSLVMGCALVVCVHSVARAQTVRTVIDTVRDTIRARTTGQVADAQMRRLIREWSLAVSEGDSSRSVGDISYVAVNREGRVYLWDPATPALWTVDANGKSIARIGRKGRGPGEYL